MTDCEIERVKVRRLWSPRLPEGFDLYRIGHRRNDPRYLVAPVLADDAPEPVVEAFLDDLRAQALGECPACGGVPRLTREPPAPGEPGRAAWEVLPLYVSVRHDDRCPVVTLADHVHRWRLPTTGGGAPLTRNQVQTTPRPGPFPAPVTSTVTTTRDLADLDHERNE